VSVSLRKATYTYGNIVAREAFTVSVPSEVYIKEADYFGMASGRDGSKFEATGLTPVRSELVDAPYVGEFPLILECTLFRTVEIGLHTLFVGEIVDVKAEEAILDEDGVIAIAKFKPFSFAPGNRSYYGFGPLLGEAFSIGRRGTA
jgi:flavin reductase (DIM6/NTAB) family NADH-FMN oxidoreductase RutF